MWLGHRFEGRVWKVRSRVEGKGANDEAGKWNGDQMLSGWAYSHKEVGLHSRHL